MKRSANHIILLIAVALLCSTATHAQQPLNLTVAQCREMALAHNEDLQQADIQLQQAELDQQIADNALLPNLDGSLMGVYTKDTEMMGMTLQMRGMYMAGITVTQPIYTGGQITTGRRMAQIGRDMVAENKRLTHDQVIADADQAYYSLMAVRSKVKMLDAYLDQMNGLKDDVNASLRAEMATENDLLRIDSKMSEIQYQRQKAINGEQLCRMALCNTIGVDFSTPITLADTLLVPTMPAVLDNNFANRPEIVLLNKQIELNEQQVKMERAAMLPTVALSLGYSRYGNIKIKGQTQAADGNYYPYSESFSGGNPMAMLSVQIPLWHWGTEKKKMRRAQLDAESARIELEKNTRLMSIEVEQAIRNVQDGYAMIETARLGVQQADENLRVMRLKHENRLATMTDVLDAQSQWQQAQSNLIEAQTQYQIYLTQYQRVTAKL